MSGPPPLVVAGLRDAMHERCFAPAPAAQRSIGAEVELLAYDQESNVPVPLLSRGGLIARLRRHAGSFGWSELGGSAAVPRFDIPGQGILSFEPGGQIEISSVPHGSVSSLAASLRGIESALRSRLADEGVRLESVGIDPFNDARAIPLQLPAERYERMATYFERLGPFGIRMMRQTAAMQISVDRGADPAARWSLLNDLAPYLIAIFANSPRYLGAPTGQRSYRAHCWRMLDATRTGMRVPGGDPAAAYVRFALSANDMMRTTAGDEWLPFDQWPVGNDFGERWERHLTTLFPEVRPRGHFEVRSSDAIPPEWYAVPLILVAGLAYDARSAADAAVLAGDSRAWLRTAGEHGLRDASLARTARDLFQIALAGAARLGPTYVSGGDLELARAYYDRFTARGRSPADDADDRVLTPAGDEHAPALPRGSR